MGDLDVPLRDKFGKLVGMEEQTPVSQSLAHDDEDIGLDEADDWGMDVDEEEEGEGEGDEEEMGGADSALRYYEAVRRKTLEVKKKQAERKADADKLEM
jgi:hypothetical protein